LSEICVSSTPPSVILLSGPPCSGKSELAVWLASRLSAVHLHLDSVLSAVLPDSRWNWPDHLLAYQIVARAIRPVLDQHRSAVLDCTYSRRVVREQVVANILESDRLVVVELRVSPEVALARFRGRGKHEAIDLTEQIVRDRALNYPYGSATAMLSGELPPARLREEVLAVIEHGPDLDRNRWVDSGRE
jgi:adenylate kinase family enzyme